MLAKMESELRLIEVSLNHAELVMWPFHLDVAEHYRYCDELFRMDLRDPAQAKEAINRWLLPEVAGWSERGLSLRREACRLCIAQGAAFTAEWLPGVDDGCKASGDFQRYLMDRNDFQKIAWEMLFREAYSPKPLSDYVRRTDRQFESVPDSPAHWGKAEYSPWPPGFK